MTTNFCKIIISDECLSLVNVIKENYPELFNFLCGLHKMKNILARISKSSVGEDYFHLLKSLPFNESFDNVNKIVYNFFKSKAKLETGTK